jgi:hypothetical protein
MGNATLVRAARSEADAVAVVGVADGSRLAELVSALSGCSVLRAVDLVQREPGDDPLTTVARSLCAVLPPRQMHRSTTATAAG